jgi:hypothetical protein
MENFIIASKNGLTVDEEGMYNHALSHGLTDESLLRIVHVYGLRLDMGGVAAVFEASNFKVNELKTNEMDTDYTDDRDLFVILTDIFF